MKKTVALLLAIVMIFSLVGCGAKSSPIDVVKKYCDAMKTLDTATMLSCLKNGDGDAEVALDDDYEEFAGLLDYFRECASQQQYEILETNVSDAQGTVKVKFTYVDASNVISETFKTYLLNAFSLAFSNPDEEAMKKAFLDAFEEKKEIIKTGTSEVTAVFNCTKTDSGWLIDEAPGAITDIISCNASKVFEEMQNAFSDIDTSGGFSSSSNDVEITEWHDFHIGETAELATIRVTVTACEELSELKSDWFSVQADEGTKFAVFTVVIENITKQPITFNAYDMPLQDDQGRQYRVYNSAYMYVDEAFSYSELAPNIKKTGSFVFQLPADSTNYYFMCGKSGTNEGYRFYGS